MELNLSEKGQINIKITEPYFNESSNSLNHTSFMEAYKYNKLEEFKNKLRRQNYFEENNDINVIYPSTK